MCIINACDFIKPVRYRTPETYNIDARMPPMEGRGGDRQSCTGLTYENIIDSQKNTSPWTHQYNLNLLHPDKFGLNISMLIEYFTYNEHSILYCGGGDDGGKSRPVSCTNKNCIKVGVNLRSCFTANSYIRLRI